MRRSRLPLSGGLVLALAIAGPAAAGSEGLRLRSSDVPAPAIASGRSSDEALGAGRLALAGNNPIEAISAFRIALAQAPQSVAALNGLAIAYDRLGRSDLARQHFEMALALEPDAADIAYNLGLALVHAGQDRAAIPHLQRAAAGSDARAAAAARRTLAQVAARLTTPTPPTQTSLPAPSLAATSAGPRIDMASSGEAVLVLAPSRPAAPLAPPAAPLATPAPVRLAAVEPALADRLGDTAALTIPMAEAVPDAPPAADPEATPAAAWRMAPSPAPRRIASHAPTPAQPQQPPPEPPAAPPASLPRFTAPAAPAPTRQTAMAARPEDGPRAAMLARLLLTGRREEQPQPAQQQAPQPAPQPPPLPDDRQALIRQAIARLETLVARIEVHHG